MSYTCNYFRVTGFRSELTIYRHGRCPERNTSADHMMRQRVFFWAGQDKPGKYLQTSLLYTIMNKPSPDNKKYASLRIVAIYALSGCLWIYVSETLLGWFASDIETLSRIDMAKGLLFILLTAALLYMLINRHTRELEASEQFLRESEERFRSIFELAAVGVALVEPRTGRMVKVNSKFCDIVGYSADELLEKRFQDITHPDDLAADLSNVARLLAGEFRSYSREKRYISRSGSIVWVKLTVSPQWAEGQEPTFQIAVVEDITERKRVETLLLQSEERYRTVVEDQTETISRYKADGTYIFVNEVFCRVFGKTRDELLGKVWHPEAFPADLLLIEEQLRTLSPSNPVVVIENRIISGTGEVRWMQFINSGLFDHEGCLVETQAVGRDITERKAVEDALRSSDERLNLALTAAKMGVWEWDVQSNAIVWSPECFEIFDVESFNGTLESFTNSLHPDDANRVMSAADKALADMTIFSVEYRIIRSDGRVRWLSNLGRPIYSEQGSPLRLIGTVQDITERKRVEEALRESEEKYRSVFEQSLDALFLTVPDGTIVDVNPAACRIFGMTIQEFRLAGRTGVVDPNDHRLAPALEERKRTGRINTELTCIRKNGERFPAEVSSVIMSGDQLHSFVIIRDISERKQADDDLRSYARRLIEMEEELRKKLATELHDEIGRDLTVVGMNLAIINAGMTDEVPANLTARVQDSGKLIKGISRTTRDIMSGLRPPVLDDYGLLAAIRWHAELFSTRTGIEVFIQADVCFPRLPVDKETALYRISQEALMNAAKHADARSVTITLRSDSGMVWFAVADDGKGFTTQAPARFQATSNWGMTIMHERAELVGGFFHVVSTPGKGTTVSVMLPLEDP